MKRTGLGAVARRDRNRREMQDGIVDAARRIVHEQGIDALTMRAVGQAIGYSAAALYEYFPSKEELYACLYFNERDGLSARMRQDLAALPPDATARQRLFTLGHGYRAFAHQQPELFRLAFGEAKTAPDLVGASDPAADDHVEGEDAFGLLVEVATVGIERGEFAPMPPMVLALAAWSMVHGFVILELNGHLSFQGPPTLRAEAGAPGIPSPDALFDLIAQLFAENIARGDAPV